MKPSPCSTRSATVPRLIVGMLVVCNVAGSGSAQQAAKQGVCEAVNLSPTHWGGDDLAKFNALNRKFGGQNSLAVGQDAVITGTTSASAVRAGLEALRQGGSAADAVLTTSLTQIALAQGSWVSCAGILTMVYYEADTGQLHNLNAGYNTVLAEEDPLSIPASGSGRTVLVPGYMAGVEAAHRRFGRLPFEQLFQPAIYYAETGFHLQAFHASLIKHRQGVLSRFPETKRIFTKRDGGFYEEGDLFLQPELAKTLRRVAEEGAQYMYTGAWAQQLVTAVQNDGGVLSATDLSQYEVLWAEPLAVPYHGYELHTHALPAQGGIHVAEALHVAHHANLRGMGHYTESPQSFFWLSQINSLFALSYLPPVTIQRLISTDDASLEARASSSHARRLWNTMREGDLPISAVPKDEDSKHSDAIVAIDRWGNIAAMVHTINTASWGQTGIFVAGVSIPDSACFQQRLIQTTGPGKRLPDPTEPLIITRQGVPVAALASIGSGLHQKTISTLLNLIDFEMDLKLAVDAPSMHLPKFGHTGRATPQVYEGDFTDELLDGVRRMGLDVVVLPKNLQSWPARGYVVGAAIDPSTGRREAISTSVLNAGALGY